MRETWRLAQEATEDIFFGQVVINWARWFLIVGGIVLVLWTADNATQMVVGIIPVMALMAVNFYLHGRYLAEQPANPALITLASVLDVAVITVVILFWPAPAQSGLGSPFFIFYYPVLLAFAFVMRPRFTVAYTLVTLGVYTGVCLLATAAGAFDAETLIARLITLGAMGGLGTYYWRIQRRRRNASTGGPAATNAPAAGS